MKLIVASILLYLFEPADQILGRWYTEGNRGIVEITKLNDKYLGKLIAIKDSIDTNSNMRRDDRNSNPNLRDRLLKGIDVFWDIRYSAERKMWDGGMVYNPENGREARCVISAIDDNTIRVKGYISFEWLGKSQIWKRKN